MLLLMFSFLLANAQAEIDAHFKCVALRALKLVPLTLFPSEYLQGNLVGQLLYPDGLDTRIRGGNDAEYGEFPFAVALLNTSTSQEVACGGAIVNENYIVTSATCVSKYASRATDEMYAILGASYLILNGTRYGLSSVKIHEEYNETLRAHDIAVVRVNQSIVFNDVIKSVTLPDDNSFIGGGENVTELGYGRNIHYARNVLQKLPVETMDTATCQERFRARDIPIFGAIHLCVKVAWKMGLCYGDYGSPLVQNDTLVGISSFNILCGEAYPDVFTRVSYYTTWIEINTQPDL